MREDKSRPNWSLIGWVEERRASLKDGSESPNFSRTWKGKEIAVHKGVKGGMTEEGYMEIGSDNEDISFGMANTKKGKDYK